MKPGKAVEVAFAKANLAAQQKIIEDLSSEDPGLPPEFENQDSNSVFEFISGSIGELMTRDAFYWTLILHVGPHGRAAAPVSLSFYRDFRVGWTEIITHWEVNNIGSVEERTRVDYNGNKITGIDPASINRLAWSFHTYMESLEGLYRACPKDAIARGFKPEVVERLRQEAEQATAETADV